MGYLQVMTEKRSIFAARRRFRAGDLFGLRQSKPRTPTPNCVACGKFFAAPKRQGRPARYCSAECRKSAWQAMSSQFARDHRGEELKPGACRQCGKPIEIGRRRGRFPFFCSPACKRLALHPTVPRGPGLFDEDP
jgi:hypothetical protein